MKTQRLIILLIVVITTLQVTAAVRNRLINTFVTFTVQAGNNNTVNLKWETTGENTTRFEVERSANNTEWKSLVTIPTALANLYYYTDREPMEGYNYYRVKDVQKNNQVVYSTVNLIRVKKKIKIFIWPNPGGNEVNIKTEFTSGEINLANTEGKTILRKNITGYITTFPIARLKPGIFYLYIQHGQEKYTEEFIKL